MAYMNHDPGFTASDPLEPSEIHEILEGAGRQSEEANNRLIRLFENYLQLFRRQTWLDPQQVAGSREMWALLKRSSLQSYETQRRLHDLMDEYQRFMAREARPKSVEVPPPAPPRAPAPAMTSTPASVTASPLTPAPQPSPPPRAPAPAPEYKSEPVSPPVSQSPSSLADAAEQSALILSKHSSASSAFPHPLENPNLSPREYILEELKIAGSNGVAIRSLNQRFMNRFAMRSANPGSLWATNISRLIKSGDIRTEEKVDGRWYRLSVDGKG